MNADALPEMDPYEEVAQQGQAPPLSPAYVPDPMELDEHVPSYVPEPEHPKYHVPSDDDMQVEDQPYADDASLTAESPGYIADLESMKEDSIDYPDKPEDDDEDPEEDDDKDPEEDDDKDPEEDPSEEPELEDNDEDLEEDLSEEHEPEDEDTKEEEPSEGSDETEPFEEEETAVTPPPLGHHRARISAPLGHRAAMICVRDDIPEEDMPPRRRFILTAPLPGCDVAESYAVAAARSPRGQYDFVDNVEAG
ncbi:hypothetical protein Tco_1000861 [Tanacetum coccineum]